MTRRHVRPSDFDPSIDDGGRYAGDPRWESETRYSRDDDHFARGERRHDVPRDYEDRLEASERRALETASKTAETLSSMASWIERAQQQLNQTAEAATRERRSAPEAASVDEALASIRRIEERLAAQQDQRTASQRESADFESVLRGFESRVGQITDRLTTVPKMAGRRPLKPGASIKTAVDDIRSHQSRLERSPHAVPRPSGLPALGTLARSQTAMLTTLKQEVAKLASRIEDIPLPRAEDRRTQNEVEALRHSMAEVARRDDLTRLERGLKSLTDDIMELRRAGERSPANDDIAALQAEIRHLAQQRGGPDLASVQAELRRLSERQTAPVDLGPIARDIQGLSRKLDRVADSGLAQQSVGPDLSALQAELRRLSDRQTAPIDLGPIARDIQGLSLKLDRVADAGLAQQGGGIDLSSLQAELRRLSERQAASIDLGPIARDIQGLSRKIDRVADAGLDPAAFVALSDQIEHVRRQLTEAGAPQALGIVDEQLTAIRRDIAEFGGRQVGSRDIEALHATMDDLRASLKSLAGRPALDREVEQAVRSFGQPIEQTLSALVEKVERVERRVSDPEALDQLERQIQLLAAHVGEGSSRDPGVAALERSMDQLLGQVSSWRDGAIEAAEHAARTAVAETIDAMPVAAEVERHLTDIGDRYAAAEERTRASLANVHSSLSDVMSRLASLEVSGTRTEGARPSFAPPPAPPPPSKAAEAQLASMLRSPPPDVRAGANALSDADRPFAPPVEEDVLLEPGSGRPAARARTGGLPRHGAPDSTVPPIDTPDIKSSFIAAARRAAQAAAAESQSAQKPRPAKAGSRGAMTPSDMVGRVRQLIDSKRRPLLLAAAAIVLALGTMQIVRTQFGGSGPTATVASAPVVPAAPRAPATTTAEAPATRGDVTAATTPAPAPQPPAEPVTTQSISPAPGGTMATQPVPTPPVMALAGGSKDGSRVGDAAGVAPPATATPTKSAALGDPSVVLPTGLKQAADRGNPVALYDLASRTVDGRGVTRDPKVATGLFEKAAEKGFVPAQYRLGNAYERGIGVGRDVEQAKSWYRRAALGGNVRAMHNLAVLLADGAGAKPDFAGAIEWFTKAAEHGVRDSQFNLAVLHARGLGTSPDLARAYHWLAIAARQGDEDAGKKRDEVGQRLSPQDLARAKAGVEGWRASPAAVAANEVLVPPAGFSDAAPTPSASKRIAREARV